MPIGVFKGGSQSAAEPSEGGSLLARDYLPLLYGSMSIDLMRLCAKGLKADGFTGEAHHRMENGHTICIKDYDGLRGPLSSSAKKLLDVAAACLAEENCYRSDRGSLDTHIEIPLVEYAEACGTQARSRSMRTAEEQLIEDEKAKNRRKTFKHRVRADLHDLSCLSWSGEEAIGNKKDSYRDMHILSGYDVARGVIRIDFDVDAAAYLVNGYVMHLPTALLATDNRSPNAYVIGRKLAMHHSMNNNVKKGTDSTLSVASLLKSAPSISTFEQVVERGQRNWRDKVKKLLEKSLNDCVRVGELTGWMYRDCKTGLQYTAESAQGLDWHHYRRLMVDFRMAIAFPRAKNEVACLDAGATNGT